MKKYIIAIATVLLTAVILLFSMAPDVLSFIVLGIMTFVLVLGLILGIIPSSNFSGGFRCAVKKIKSAAKVQTVEAGLAVFQIDDLFRQRDLDAVFQEYKDTVLHQRENGVVMSDVKEFISEDFLAIRSWQGLMIQLPGILTGLGILGTFIGLISGIHTLGFQTVDEAIGSVTHLLSGIEAAFYTSISGVVLSILFNILYRMVWNGMLRDYTLFLDCYYKRVSPPAEVQIRQANLEYFQKMLDRLDRLPENKGFSTTNRNSSSSSLGGGDFLPQVAKAIQNGKIIFFLQPIVQFKPEKEKTADADKHAAVRKIVGAEALVRWNHETLGLLTPGAFLPQLEQDGYITKVDQYLWDQVCRTIRHWMDNGLRPVPITVNISMTDMLALDVPAIFQYLLKKYQLPPRCLELDIAGIAFAKNYVLCCQTTGALRRIGLKVTLDGFNGDYLAFHASDRLEVDALKLDLRFLTGEKENENLTEIFSYAKRLGIEMSINGIENAQQLAAAVKAGFEKGQGFYFSSPLSLGEFERIGDSFRL